MVCTEVHGSSVELYRMLLLTHQREKKEGVKEYRRKIKNKSTMMDTGGIKTCECYDIKNALAYNLEAPPPEARDYYVSF